MCIVNTNALYNNGDAFHNGEFLWRNFSSNIYGSVIFLNAGYVYGNKISKRYGGNVWKLPGYDRKRWKTH